MQLSDAIERWVAEHRNGLSASTLLDIDGIADSITRCGHDSLDCASVGAPQRISIVADAEEHLSLSRQAIAQFVDIVVDWGRTAPDHVLAPASSDELLDALPSDTDAWTDSSDALNQAYASLDDPVDRVDDNPLDLVDEDDLDPAELAEIDDDLSITDEHDLAASELAAIDGDLDQLLRPETPGDPTKPDVASERLLDTPDAAGASFLRALDQPKTRSFGDRILNDNEGELLNGDADVEQVGVFSEAAQASATRSVDWIAVVYFAIAAICFALVFYFYFSS